MSTTPTAITAGQENFFQRAKGVFGAAFFLLLQRSPQLLRLHRNEKSWTLLRIMLGCFGAALVVAFMVLTYGLFGVFASIAVAINVGMIFGILSLLNATLTLPGIIGIVLTIGIAVDSNVLIYERIREEVRSGRTPITAIDAGFTRALATILDSNITTFIAAAVLFFIGTGPVRGFAVTLGIGILTTVFTAFTLTRLIVAWWVRWKRPQSVPI